jgi:cell division protein FtsW (lipid II flippase)
MQKAFEEYIGQVCQQVRCKKAHEGIREELLSHLEDQAEAYTAVRGLDPEKAQEEAVRQMGDPVLVGGQLDAAHRPRPEWSVLTLAFLLMAGGIVLQVLVLSGSRFQQELDWMAYGIPVGAVALLIIYFLDYTMLAKMPLLAFLGIAGVCFLLLLRFKGAHGLITPYVSYIALLFVPAFCGILYSQKGKKYTGVLVCILFMAVPAVICMAAPNYTTLAIVFASCVILLLAAVVKNWFCGKKLILVLMLAIPVAVFAFAYIFSSTGMFMLERFIHLFDTSGSFFMSKVKDTLAGAQWVGMTYAWPFNESFALSMSLWQGDLMLTAIIGLYGWCAGLAVIVGIALLVWRLFAAACRQKNTLGFFVCLSVAILIAFQSIVFIMVNTGLMMVGVLSLPLMLGGGTNLAVNMCLVGLFLSAYKYNGIVSDKIIMKRKMIA